MSHDEQPEQLARWLDQPPGTDPPDDLDPEVLQAIYAMRPERAPAPRVTADDILASLTSGPLADPAEAETPVTAPSRSVEGEVVPFPTAEVPIVDDDQSIAPKTGRTGVVRWLALMGGTGGLGLAMVAAATLLVVATPAMWRANEPAATDDRMNPARSAAPAPAAMAPAEEPATEEADAVDAAPRDAVKKTADSSLARSEPEPPPPPAAAAQPIEAEATEEAYQMDDGSAYRQRRDIIPEALEATEVDAIADADEPNLQAPAQDAAGPASGDELADEEPPDLGDLPERARPPGLTSDWRTGLDGDRLAQIEAKVTEADTSSGSERGRLLQDAASMVTGTSMQILCVRAAEAYMSAGAYQSAEGVARIGLTAGSSGPEAAWLQYWLGQALEYQGRLSEAESAYRDALAR